MTKTTSTFSVLAVTLLVLASVPMFNGPTAVAQAEVGRVDAQPCPFGAYWPLEVGYSWKGVNTDPPFDISFIDALGPYKFGGYPDAVLLGPFDDPGFFAIVANDGVTFSWLGFWEDGKEEDIEDVHLGSFSDGHVFEFDSTPDEYTVIRLWEALDHSLTGDYPVDPSLKDVIVLVWYHTKFDAPNSQNAIVESGGGVQYPDGVTDIDFLQKDVGLIAHVGVDAGTGDFDGRYQGIASFDCNDNQVPDHTDIDDETSQDIDQNCIPDECHCVWDFDADGNVGINDFLDLLANWSNPYGIKDFLALLAAWGDCK